MDIEGEELGVLNGALRSIAPSRPAPAASMYHCRAQLWETPLLIDAWQLGCCFVLRSHARGSFYLLLHAVPD